ncbi:membrane protein insertion efficiency factor YidD [Demequina sp. B12]|uniref:membrane protein insertion efficiency factor YidD n=1 Tax=Demequina sp. B12 TaxID=2992757 RepID=UPI00237BC9C5|nr:membrane protein insertion efficiency factor YidD [Demequina sp. B12]MDE0572127.1 membrane protein insertion efficiency factor YidD [Demequina sp. B12]
MPRYVFIGIIRFYQLVISPLTGPTCKYYPSCSSYGLQAVKEHGAFKGFILGVWRVLRCNPWSHGGVDDVPRRGEPLFRRRPQTSPEATASLVQPKGHLKTHV